MKILPIIFASAIISISSPATAWWGFSDSNMRNTVTSYSNADSRANISNEWALDFDFKFKVKMKAALKSKGNNHYQSYYQSGYVVPTFSSVVYPYQTNQSALTVK